MGICAEAQLLEAAFFLYVLCLFIHAESRILPVLSLGSLQLPVNFLENISSRHTAMGDWKLEAGRMASYMAFPVLVFWLFHHPGLFEGRLEKMRNQMNQHDPNARDYILDRVDHSALQSSHERKTSSNSNTDLTK